MGRDGDKTTSFGWRKAKKRSRFPGSKQVGDGVAQRRKGFGEFFFLSLFSFGWCWEIF
jgi:hypothetical protein